MSSADTIPSAIRVAILWHMHQPNYQEPQTSRLAMPWVRLHATKDYLDMPLMAARDQRINVTFNLVPSLLDQLDLYQHGGTDPHLELSRINPSEASAEVRQEIIGSFFMGNAATMIEPYPHYRALYRKARANGGNGEKVARLFSSAELRDLQVWSNLVWVDPLFREDEPIRSLLAKGRHFTEEEKYSLLDWQFALMGRIVPTYRRLLAEGRIDVSFTPYYHPILPLLCDTNVALEALPSLTLPHQRFRHPEDAQTQILLAAEKYRELFGQELVGMWPSEGSVSEEVMTLAEQAGLTWLATDEEILYHSLTKSRLSPVDNPVHAVYQVGNGPKLFFRDHGLSDRIGFVYSTWPAERAVSDFIDHLKALRQRYAESLDSTVIPIILDGENAWEYFPDDGRQFLETLYTRLAEEPEIETVSFTRAAKEIPPRQLPRLFAGSWINHNFRIWIGHPEDNKAWDLLSRARKDLITFEQEHADFSGEKRSRAWRQIYIAEGSDWCWWYGDEHRGAYNAEFDRIFRRHLMSVYELLALEVPAELYQPIHGGGAESFTLQPVDLLTVQIDGRVTHFYEWSGAGFFDCVKAGGAMHRVDHLLSGLHFAYDHNRVYIRLDFISRHSIELLRELKIVIGLTAQTPRLIELSSVVAGAQGEESGKYAWAVGEIVEVAVERRYIWSEEYGTVGLHVELYDSDSLLESWPEGDPIMLEVPERNKEMFWPM